MLPVTGGSGSVDYATGAWSLSGFIATSGTNIYSSTAVSVTYSYGGISDFPVSGMINSLFEINFASLYTGTREGLNSIFVFADLDNDGIWNPCN